MALFSRCRARSTGRGRHHTSSPQYWLLPADTLALGTDNAARNRWALEWLSARGQATLVPGPAVPSVLRPLPHSAGNEKGRREGQGTSSPFLAA